MDTIKGKDFYEQMLDRDDPIHPITWFRENLEGKILVDEAELRELLNNLIDECHHVDYLKKEFLKE